MPSKRILLLAVSSTAVVALSFGNIASAAPDYRSLAKIAYGDEVCSPILMSVDLEKSAMSTPAVFTGAKPRNTACVLLQSFVRMPGANIVSRDVVATAGANMSGPQTFGSVTLPSLRASHGELASVQLVPAKTAAASDAYVLGTADGKWRIVFDGNPYDLDWQPTAIYMNPVTHTPYAVGANGHLWTPTFQTAYQTWDKDGGEPFVRAIDSKGNLLVTSLVYDRLYDVWINKRYVGRYSDVDRDFSVNFTDAKAVDLYYPGYVKTYSDALAFDQNDHLVVYRQEGRVFTRTAYDLK
jgi:hypothetical protein